MIRKTFLFLSVLASGFCADHLSAGNAIGVVSEMRGDVVRYSGQATEALAMGAIVYEQDVIATQPKGFVTLTLNGTTRVTLGPNTRFAIDPFIATQGTDLEIVSGPLGFESEQELSPENEAIRTVFGMIGVRG